MKQLPLLNEKIRTEFGGSLLKAGKRKAARPLDLSAPIHLVLKSDDQVSMIENFGVIKTQFGILSQKFGVRIYGLAVHEDHIHGLVKFPNRTIYRGWIRALSGTLTRKVPGLKWKLRPYTRILTWGQQFKKVRTYIAMNQSEADFLNEARQTVTAFEDNLKFNPW
jgi:REP element-mobilizing transposase RayT